MLTALVGAERLIKKLLLAISDLDAAVKLPSCHGSPHSSLGQDIYELRQRFPKQVNIDAMAILLEHVIEKTDDDESIWSAVYGLFREVFVPPSTPTIPPEDNSTNIETKGPILRKLHENWTNDYLPESLDALRDMIRDNEKTMGSGSKFYAKTLIFVQSSGMGKSRLADAFGEECPMVNFVLREEGTLGYPPADSEVLSFMCKRLSEQDKEKITDTPTKKLYSKRITEEDKKKIINSPSSKRLKSIMYKQPPKEDQKMAAESSRSKEARGPSPKSEKEYTSSRISETKEAEISFESMMTTVWNHSVAVGLLQASFEICKLRPLFITTEAQVLIQNDLCHSQCVGRKTKFRDKLKRTGSYQAWDDGTIQTRLRKYGEVAPPVKRSHRLL